MIRVDKIEEIPELPSPIAFTMGTFDGVHLGHQYLLRELKKYGTCVVLTFSNYPGQILKNKTPHPLCTLEKRLKLFETLNVDCTIVIPFTLELSKQSYSLFLKNLKHHLPFTTLILGKGAAFGHKNKGDETHIKALQTELGFQAIYLEKLTVDGQKISSKNIRELLLKGERKKALSLVGHPRDLL